VSIIFHEEGSGRAKVTGIDTERKTKDGCARTVADVETTTLVPSSSKYFWRELFWNEVLLLPEKPG
jgi:hypothetical protein